MEAGLPGQSGTGVKAGLLEWGWGRTLGRGRLPESEWGRVEVALLEWAGLGHRQGTLPPPHTQGFLDAQLACSKALLHCDTFRVQLLGKQVNSLQWVPTALGVHERAACWDFDWERRERERWS